MAAAARADISLNLALISPGIYHQLRFVQALIKSEKYSDALTQLDYLKSVTTNAYGRRSYVAG
jgi:hypothetical protein